jgi:hypothetical protein
MMREAAPDHFHRPVCPRGVSLHSSAGGAPRMVPDQPEPGVGEPIAPFEQGPPAWPPDILFGAGVGLLMGACVGWACCWLVGEVDSAGQGACVGALAGAFAGRALGFRHRKGRADTVSSELGTTICTGYALLPALLIFLGGLGLVRGKLSGFLMVGAACAGPMAGLLVGGLLDRAYEGILRWRHRKVGSKHIVEGEAFHGHQDHPAQPPGNGSQKDPE